MKLSKKLHDWLKSQVGFSSCFLCSHHHSPPSQSSLSGRPLEVTGLPWGGLDPPHTHTLSCACGAWGLSGCVISPVFSLTWTIWQCVSVHRKVGGEGGGVEGGGVIFVSGSLDRTVCCWESRSNRTSQDLRVNHRYLYVWLKVRQNNFTAAAV